MDNKHLIEWKRIKERYESMEQSPEIRFRISRIDNLIKSAEIQEKEMNHFK